MKALHRVIAAFLALALAAGCLASGSRDGGRRIAKSGGRAAPVKARAEVVGVYPVKAPEPCHLVEMVVHGLPGPFDFVEITQEVRGQPRADWQAPWMEQVLNAEGTAVLASDTDLPTRPDLLRGDVRLVFFFHRLDAAQKLITPWGAVALPAPMAMPARLEMIRYETP